MAGCVYLLPPPAAGVGRKDTGQTLHSSHSSAGWAASTRQITVNHHPPTCIGGHTGVVVHCPSYIDHLPAPVVLFLPLPVASQGYGFNTFGEVCACWAQDIILIALIFRFNKTPIWAVAVTALLIALGCCYLLSPACPHHVLAALQASTIATMALGSRLPQILLNMRRGNAGVLSVTSCMLNVAGNSARIFTTLVLTGDMLLLSGALTQGCLNTVLLCQSITTAKARRSQAADLAGSEAVGSSGLQAQVEPQKKQQDVPSAAIDPGSSSLVVPAPA